VRRRADSNDFDPASCTRPSTLTASEKHSVPRDDFVSNLDVPTA
jgi:hypothetical protein